MAEEMSDECKERIKVLEDEIMWALKDEYRHTLFTELITFLAISCRYERLKLDNPCKELMIEYEHDIVALRMRTDPARITGLETVLSRIRKDLNER